MRQTITFQKSLPLLQSGRSVVIAPRRPVRQRFRAGQARSQPPSQPLRVGLFEQPFADILSRALGNTHKRCSTEVGSVTDGRGFVECKKKRSDRARGTSPAPSFFGIFK